MTIIVRQDPDQARSLGNSSLHEIPVLYREPDDPETSLDGLFIEPAYAYLRAKALGTWCGAGIGGAYDFSAQTSSPNSLKTHADHLANFFNWCARFRADWRSIDYDRLLSDYQARMVSGEWSAHGKPLSPATINQRISRIADFLSFAAAAGYRASFQVKVAGSRRAGSLGSSIRRTGTIRNDEKHLTIPTVEAVRHWLSRARAASPQSHHLMYRTAVETGLRREEIVSFQADQLPVLSANDGFSTMAVGISFGTKGRRRLNDPDKKGKARQAQFSVHLVEDLIRYRDTRRRVILARHKDRYSGRPPKALFLSEKTGLPYRPNSLTKAWTQSDHRPNEEWTPHSARHFWACYTLIEHLTPIFTDREAHGARMAQAELLAAIDHLIAVEIRDALGHVSTETTYQYLRWVSSYFQIYGTSRSVSEIIHG